MNLFDFECFTIVARNYCPFEHLLVLLSFIHFKAVFTWVDFRSRDLCPFFTELTEDIWKEVLLTSGFSGPGCFFIEGLDLRLNDSEVRSVVLLRRAQSWVPQGSATRPVNSSALMVDSLMSSRNGRLAMNTSRSRLMERPMATTAVAAAASLPSSFTCKRPQIRSRGVKTMSQKTGRAGNMTRGTDGRHDPQQVLDLRL